MSPVGGEVRTLNAFARSRFVRNVASTLAAQGASLIFSIVNAALVARLLGTEGKGAVALALMVPGVLALLLNGGIGIANVYLVGSGRLALREASRASVTFAILACAAGAVVAGALSVTGWLPRIVPGVPPGVQVFAMILLPLNVLDGYLASLLMGLQRISMLNVVATVVAALNALGIVLFVGLWHWGIMGAVGASLAGGILSILLKGLPLVRMGANFLPSWEFATIHRMTRFGMRGQVGNILQFFNYRLDTFIVNYFQGPSAVGIYGVAVVMAELLWQLPNAVGFVIFPTAAASREATLNALTPKIFRSTLALTAMGGVLMALGGQTFINWVYSPNFAGAYIPLLGLIPGVVLLGGAKVLANEMAGRGYPHYNSAISGTGLAVTVVLDLLLIPRMGAMGAAVASSVAYTTSFLLSLILHGAVVRKVPLAGPRDAEAVSSAP